MIRELYIYSPPDRGIEPPKIPQTREKPIPQSTADISVAIIKFPPVYTPKPKLIITHMLGVRPWFMNPTPNASINDSPRTRPLALRAKAICSDIFSASYRMFHVITFFHFYGG